MVQTGPKNDDLNSLQLAECMARKGGIQHEHFKLCHDKVIQQLHSCTGESCVEDFDGLSELDRDHVDYSVTWWSKKNWWCEMKTSKVRCPVEHTDQAVYKWIMTRNPPTKQNLVLK